MAEVKDKVVTVESLSALHEYNNSTYLTNVNPNASGVMVINGELNVNSDDNASGNITSKSLTIGNVRFEIDETDANRLNIVFVNEI